MDINEVISANLTAWMEDNPGLNTLKKIAAKSHVGFGTVQRAKNKTGNVTIQNLAAISDAFGKSLVDLLITNNKGDSPSGADVVVYGADNSVTLYQVKDVAGQGPRSVRQDRINAINQLMSKMDDYGIVALLEKAKDVANDYPIDVSKTAS